MEFVPLPGAISHHNWIEADILEALQTHSAGHLGVEAAAAKVSVTLLNRAIVHGIIARHVRATRFATDRAALLLNFVSHYLISSDLILSRCSRVDIASILADRNKQDEKTLRRTKSARLSPGVRKKEPAGLKASGLVYRSA
jgi:hypothetical protein